MCPNDETYEMKEPKKKATSFFSLLLLIFLLMLEKTMVHGAFFFSSLFDQLKVESMIFLKFCSFGRSFDFFFSIYITYKL